MKLKWIPSVPTSERSEDFLQGMLDRMSTSYFKYGELADGYPDKVDALKSLKARIKRYRSTGNREWLIDVANFAMIEYMRPRHPRAHLRATDSKESPGRKWHGELDSSSRGNKEA